ncbi:MAG: TIGR04283 family arsenosugar biosynthesis glycosyltransferase [Syntrophomonadaceae bacterium]
MPTKISVIVPILNEEECLPELLECLQLISSIEIIISDGGSSDRSPEICSRYPVKMVTGSAGRGMQLNRGAQLATAPVLLFLHADCQFEPIVVEQVLKAIKEGYHWGCATMDFDERLPFYRGLAFLSNLRARYWKSCYGDQAIWCRKDVFLNIGGFPDIPLMEDLAFSHHLRSKYCFRVVAGRVITSTRRFKDGGPLITLIKMQVLKVLYFLGVSPERLYDYYQQGRRVSL